MSSCDGQLPLLAPCPGLQRSEEWRLCERGMRKNALLWCDAGPRFASQLFRNGRLKSQNDLLSRISTEAHYLWGKFPRDPCLNFNGSRMIREAH